MRPLDLDHLHERRRAPWVRFAIPLLALAFGVDQALYYRSLGDAVGALELRLAHAKRFVPHAAPAPGIGPAEIALARDTVGRLATPWERLFGALEAAHTDQVALLSIEPDAEARSVIVSGEAKDYLAALTYLAGLQNQTGLRSVHLVRHETGRAGSPRPLAFAISASWKEAK